MRPGHRPLYPAWRPRPRVHLLAAWHDDGTITTEDGELAGPFAAWSDLSAWLFTHRVDLLVRSLLRWSFWPFLVADDRFKVVAAGTRETTRPSCAVGRAGRNWSGIYPTDDVDPDQAMAARREIRDLRPDLGTQPTPTAFGASLMRKLVDGCHTTPSLACLRDLRAGLHGGRQVAFGDPGTAAAEVFELDRYMAYVSEAKLGVPIGTAVGIGGPWLTAAQRRREADRCTTWYAKVTVFIDAPLAFGVFPVRHGERLVYPTFKGCYETWLWREEVEYAEANGVECWVQLGWGWKTVAPVLAAWALEVGRLREACASDLARQFIKRAGQAAIGLHAMAPGRRLIVPLVGEGDCLNDGDQGAAYQAVPDPDADPDPPLMLHWSSYIYARARLSLYRLIQSEWDDGIVLAHTDAIYTLRRPRAEPRAELGGARLRALHNFVLLASNAYACDEKTVQPGVPRASRPTGAVEEALSIALRDLRDRPPWRRARWMDHYVQHLEAKLVAVQAESEDTS